MREGGSEDRSTWEPRDEDLGPSWSHLGAILGSFRGILEPSWGHLGASWGHLGDILGHLGAILGHVEAILGASWAS